MYYKRRNKILFRDYYDFGYITDNRNFDYELKNETEKVIGDKVLSKTAKVMFSILTRKPCSFEEIIKNLKEVFQGVDETILIRDVVDFYNMLERDGFVISGETIEQCEDKEKVPFQNIIESKNKKIDASDNSTQFFFNNYFKGIPQITSLQVEIIKNCNENCIHCYIPHENKIELMSEDLFYSIINQCKLLNVLHITISGGEPLLHNKILDFLRKCRKNDFSVSILSNLTLLNDSIIEEMKKNPLLCVQTSVYSIDENIHDSITNTHGSLKKTKANILRLIDNNIPVQISCPVMKLNKDSFMDVVDWAKKNKININCDASLIGRYNQSVDNLDSRLSLSEYKIFMEQKIKIDSNFVHNILQDSKKRHEQTYMDSVCKICHLSLCVFYNGNVYPCAGWQSYILGNLKDNTLKDIWEKSPKVKFLRDLKKSNFPRCLKCENKDYCDMCMVRNANESSDGNPFELNRYYCDIAKITKETLLKNNLFHK